MAHELRQPLGVISNSAYFLNRKLKNKEKEVADEKVMRHLVVLDCDFRCARNTWKRMVVG